ncbi:5830_t:CDS:2 [Acaulospora morrowiae]|uniref:5830_t:CDS:1 n=1 Tax=Acaulospora morrowiae TaxID=94023 RepID=A0A9N8WCP8_9GLOM|nr:5830_t:CDS:2 [Acaulospora morrowiae]
MSCQNQDNMQHDLGHMDIECSHCSTLHWLDECLTNSLRKNLKFGSCCLNGKVVLPLLHDPPPFLRMLFDGEVDTCPEFRKNICQYNVAHAFTSLGAKIDAHEILLQAYEDGIDEDVAIYLHHTNTTDKHHYNLPMINEIAVILLGNGSVSEAMRDIIIRLRGGSFEHIHKGYPAYLPLHYVLLFSHGELGWHKGLCHVLTDTEEQQLDNQNKHSHLTQMNFYSFHILSRNTEFSTILQVESYSMSLWLMHGQQQSKIGEIFYLRLLLIVIRGPQSFNHLKTVNNITHPTFKDACLALGLLEDDEEWIQCLEEAAVIYSGFQLRLLFAVILIHCTPTQPQDLGLCFRVNLCNDLLYRLSNEHAIREPTESQIFDFRLSLLDNILHDFN